MRHLLLLPLILLCACAPQEPTGQAPEAAAGWSDDMLWGALEAQDHRDRSALLALLGHDRARVRERAALAFASSPDTAATPTLIKALADSDPSVRKAVALAIGNANDSTAWVALSKASDAERDTSVLHVMLEQAFKAEVDLKQVKDPERFFQLLVSGNTSIRTRAAQQLARWPSDKMGELEEKILDAAGKESDPTVRMFLVAALKHYRSDAVKSALMEWGIRDTLMAIRVSALRALGAREDAALQSYFLDRTNDGMQSVRLTAVEQLERIKAPLDAQPIWEVAQKQGDPFTQLPLYGLVLKHGDESQRLIARKLLEAQAALDNMPYAEAAIFKAQTNDPEMNISSLREVIVSSRSAVERTASFDAALTALVQQAKTANMTPVELYGGIMGDALASGDAGLIATACEKLAAWEDAQDLQRVLAASLEQKARTALLPIRDLEALQNLDIAAAKRDGKPAPVHIAPPFNHAIDRQRLVALKDGQRYRIKTTKGDIVIAVEPMSAPGTCVAFDSLVTSAFYNGKFFHRVIPNFVAQGGCPRGDGYGSMDWTLRTEIGYEGFTKGAVGIASAGRDTESCQFFIMTAAYPTLDGRYTRFAHVVEGQDVADVLAVGDLILAIQKIP